jgi:hypothetical protein
VGAGGLGTVLRIAGRTVEEALAGNGQRWSRSLRGFEPSTRQARSTPWGKRYRSQRRGLSQFMKRFSNPAIVGVKANGIRRSFRGKHNANDHFSENSSIDAVCVSDDPVGQRTNAAVFWQLDQGSEREPGVNRQADSTRKDARERGQSLLRLRLQLRDRADAGRQVPECR